MAKIVFEGDLHISESDVSCGGGHYVYEEIMVKKPGTVNEFNLAALITGNNLNYKRVKITVEEVDVVEPVRRRRKLLAADLGM